MFDSFIQTAPPLTVADLRRLRPYTFNLNPALQGEVVKAVARKPGPAGDQAASPAELPPKPAPP